jgi:hypothetical protein
MGRRMHGDVRSFIPLNCVSCEVAVLIPSRLSCEDEDALPTGINEKTRL